jgi:hypothetical protein
MSNMVRNMQRRRNGSNTEQMMKHINSSQKSKSINFGERVLPRTFLIDVKTGALRIGDDVKPIGETEPIIVVDNDAETVSRLVDILNEHIEAKDIDKVILDNQTDFKIQSLEEFRDNVARQIKAQIQSLEESRDEMVKQLEDKKTELSSYSSGSPDEKIAGDGE